MRAFPALDPELRERLALGEDDFATFLTGYLGAVPPRDYGPEQADHALGYPWARPPDSYRLRDGEVHPYDGDTEDRHPILAFGSNASPSALTRKFAHFETPEDRDVLVLAGDLHDFDVGPAAAVAAYGAMPATLFESPGTRVRAAIVYATDAQATQLTWSELTYRFGRLRPVRFVAADHEVDEVFAYVHRFGHYRPDGEPLALAAVEAEGRRSRAVTQRELLGRIAAQVVRDGASAEDLIEAVYVDGPGAVLARLREHVMPCGEPFASERWTPLTGASGG